MFVKITYDRNMCRSLIEISSKQETHPECPDMNFFTLLAEVWFSLRRSLKSVEVLPTRFSKTLRIKTKIMFLCAEDGSSRLRRNFIACLPTERSHIPKDRNILTDEPFHVTRPKIYPSVLCLFFMVMRNFRHVL